MAAELKDTPTKLTIVYSPVYDEYLEQIARSFMSSGDVYMGAEDLGYKGIDSSYTGEYTIVNFVGVSFNSAAKSDKSEL